MTVERLLIEHNRLLSQRVDELDARLQVLEAGRLRTTAKRLIVWMRCRRLLPARVVEFLFRVGRLKSA